MRRNLLNVLAFQACWFASVLGAADGLPWAGPVVLVTWMIAHLIALRPAAMIELRVLVAAAILGWFADSALVLAGFISFPEPAQFVGPSPLWMVGLWVGFAATLRHAMGWLCGRWWLGAALGGIGGALSYSGGQALGAIALQSNIGVLAVAVQFAVATPLLLLVVHYSERFDYVSRTGPAPGGQS
ncbi:MAG: hypothetical protein ACI9W2_003344 [Gammaproteobacteria bacterium]